MLARKDFRQAIGGLLAICIVVFYILVLVGCISTSPGLPGIYLVKLANNATKAEVHVGLFGLCAGTDPVNLTCAGTVAQAIAVNASSASTKFFLPGSSTVAPTSLQPLLALAAGIQSGSTGPGGVLSIVYIPLFLSALCFVGAAGSLLTHRIASRGGQSDDYADEKGYAHTRNAWNAAVMLTTGAVMAALAAAISSTVAVRALLFSGTGLPGSDPSSTSTTAIDVSGGTSIQVLEWLIVVLTMLWHPLLESVWRKVL